MAVTQANLNELLNVRVATFQKQYKPCEFTLQMMEQFTVLGKIEMPVPEAYTEKIYKEADVIIASKRVEQSFLRDSLHKDPYRKVRMLSEFADLGRKDIIKSDDLVEAAKTVIDLYKNDKLKW